MTNYILTFLSTSLFMAIIIIFVLILGRLMPKFFFPKLRYAAWIIILVGLIIPLRPMIGNGLVTLPVLNAPAAYSQDRISETSSTITEPTLTTGTEENIPAYAIIAENDTSVVQNIPVAYVIVIMWAVVALAVFIYHVLRYISFNKLIKRWGKIVDDERVLSILHEVKAQKKIANKTIGLRRCDFISTSMIVGFFRPVILLPDKNFDIDELELIFHHELIHYKRGDLYVKLLSVIAVSINWFNPVVYLMSAAMQTDCEASCDETVIADVGEDNRQFYAEIIIDMIGSKKSNGTILSTCFYGSKKGIRKRMEAIMSGSSGAKKVAFFSLSVLLTLIILSGSLVAFSTQAPFENLHQEEHQTPDIGLEDDNNDQHSTGQITSQQARDIAVEFVGYGTVYDIIAFTENGRLTFEVDVRHDTLKYIVSICADSGSIKSMISVNADDSENIETTPEIMPESTQESEDAGTESESAPQDAPESTSQSSESAQEPTVQPTPEPPTNPTTPPTAPPTTPPVNENNHGHGPGHSGGQNSGHGDGQSGGQNSGQGGGQGRGHDNRPSNPSITLERAVEIAILDLADRGINATYRSSSGMSWERGQWVWELLFRTQGERMPFIEFYINVDNGNIVKFEWDD